MNALVFVIKTVVRAASRVSAEEVYHLILVESHIAHVCVKLLVVIVKLTGFAIRNPFLLFHSLFNNDEIWDSVYVSGIVFALDKRKEILTAFVGDVVASFVDVFVVHELDHICNLGNVRV